MADKREKDDRVGYGRPPKHFQFKPGVSGNPAGRPRKQDPDELDIAGMLNEPVVVKAGKKRQKMSPFEIGLRRLVKKAVQENNLRAVREFLRFCETYRILQEAPPPKRAGGVIVVPKVWDWDEWMEMFRRLGPPPWPGERSGLVEEARDDTGAGGKG